MVDGIYTMGDVLITDHIRDEIPGIETSHIKNRLLDGSWHLQTVGAGSKDIQLTVYGSLEAVNILNNLQSLGTPVKVRSREESKVGFIDGRISWSEEAPNYYRGSMTVLVTEEL